MNSKSMLSAKYIRIHGMNDTRWTINDQMLQYKGLVKLYKRDKKIISVDTNVAIRKQKFELKKLKKDIETNRNQLQGLIIGDKQEMRNALAEHKSMQLAYQELPALQVIDHIYQNNFTKRKQMDMLKYKTMERTQILIDLKLRHAVLEDRIKYQQSELPLKKTAERITGNVQDAVLKKEAALVVNDAYLKIINIMKKDTLYYDAILEDLKNDAKCQAQCMIRATQLGQLAMEYLDDRQSEFKELEETVKRDMKQRLEDLNGVSRAMEKIQGTMKLLIRKDSDINCGVVTPSQEFNNKDLTCQVNDIEKVLLKLESITMVTNFKSIYPCLTEQLRQKYRLEELQQRNSINHETLLNKVDHATTMKHIMENTMIETTNHYIEEKKRIAKDLIAQRERKRQIEKRIEVKNKLLASINISLKQLETMCQIVNDGSVKKPPEKNKVILLPTGEPLYRENCPDPGEFEGRKIIDILVVKIKKLVTVAAQVSSTFEEPQATQALVAFGSLVSCHSKKYQIKHTLIEEESLIDETTTADATSVPTREEIKNISAAIFKQYSVDPDLAPILPSRK